MVSGRPLQLRFLVGLFKEREGYDIVGLGAVLRSCPTHFFLNERIEGLGSACRSDIIFISTLMGAQKLR